MGEPPEVATLRKTFHRTCVRDRHCHSVVHVVFPRGVFEDLAERPALLLLEVLLGLALGHWVVRGADWRLLSPFQILLGLPLGHRVRLVTRVVRVCLPVGGLVLQRWQPHVVADVDGVLLAAGPLAGKANVAVGEVDDLFVVDEGHARSSARRRCTCAGGGGCASGS